MVNPRLVRGLDYYGLTVFEWVTDRLGAQGTVCAGGRYNGLVEQLGGKPCSAVGFAMGIERLTLLLEACEALPELAPSADVYIVSGGDAEARWAAIIAEQLRDARPGLRVLSHSGGGSFKSQFKKADKSGAHTALVIGEDELASGEITLKPLRDPEAGQKRLTVAEVIDYLGNAS